jgi:hypothetical protein
MAEVIDSPDDAAVAPTKSRHPVVDVVVIAVAGLITSVLCWVAYSFPEASSDASVRSTGVADYQTSSLIRLPRTEAVCEELLRRDDVDDETLLAALIRLGRLQQKSTAEILIPRVASVDEATEEATLTGFSRIAELASEHDGLRDQLEALALAAHSPASQRLATAMLVSVDGNGDALFAATGGNAERLTVLLNSLPLVHSAEIQATLYDNIRHLLFDENETRLDLKTTAIAVMVKLRGREELKAVDLIRLVEVKGLQNTAIGGFSRLPSEKWPAEELSSLAARITSWIAWHSLEDRHSQEMQTAISLTERISEQFSGEKRERLTDRLMKLRPSAD